MWQWLAMRRQVPRVFLIGLWCLAVLSGIALVKLPINVGGGWSIIVATLLLVPALNRQRLAVIFMVFSGLLFGLWRGNAINQQLEDLSSYYGQKVSLCGVVSEDVIIGERGESIIKISSLSIDNVSFVGTARITLTTEAIFQRGDIVSFAGKLKPGYGNYQAAISYAKLLAHKPTHQPVIEIRNSFAGGVKNAISEPAASLGLGFLLGQRNVLPEKIDEDMRLLGLTHIVVASGYNLTILVRISRRLFARISKFQAMVSSLGMTVFFMLVTGFSPSMTRAGIVTLLSVWAWYYGRNIHPVLIIVLSAALTAIWNPLSVWSDVGWYLSFLSFAGVLLLSPMLTKRIFKKDKPALPLQVITETISAQVATLPLVLLIFGRLPILSVVSNGLIVPFIPLAMLLTFIAGLAGVVLGEAASYIGFLSQTLINYMLNVVETMSKIPWASTDINISPSVMVIIYLALAALCLILWKYLKFNFSKVNITD